MDDETRFAERMRRRRNGGRPEVPSWAVVLGGEWPALVRGADVPRAVMRPDGVLIWWVGRDGLLLQLHGEGEGWTVQVEDDMLVQNMTAGEAWSVLLRWLSDDRIADRYADEHWPDDE